MEFYYSYYWNYYLEGFETYNHISTAKREDIFQFWSYYPQEFKDYILYMYTFAGAKDQVEVMERYREIFEIRLMTTPELAFIFRHVPDVRDIDLNIFSPSILTHLPLTRFYALDYHTVAELYFVDSTFSFISDIKLIEFAKMMFMIDQYMFYETYHNYIYNWYTIDLYLILPEIFFFFTLLLIFISVIILPLKSKVQFILNISWLMFGFLFLLYVNAFSANFDIFYSSITSDIFAYSCKLIIIAFSSIFLGLISAFMYFDKYIKSFEYVLIYNLIVYSLIFLMGVNDFLGLFLSLELQSLSLYILAAYKTTSAYSTEAGIKYFILGAIASGMILFGISIIYGLSGSINFYDLEVFSFGFSLKDAVHPTLTLWYDIAGVATMLPYWAMGDFYNLEAMSHFYKNMEFTYFIGFLFIIIGLFFKLGVAPFHMWLPDVYEGAPLISTALFALIPKIALIFLLIKFTAFHFFFNLDVWFFIFMGCGFLSIFIGTFGALFQTKIKRLFAYSAISHMGFILVSLSNFTAINFAIAFIYGITYIFLNISFFAILICLRKFDGSELKDIRELSSLFKNNKILAFFFSLNLFSIAGIPPLFGFYSKWLVLLSLVNNNLWFSAFNVLILSMIGVYYYIKLIKILFFELNDNFVQFIVPNRFLSYIIVISSFFNIFFMLFANLFFIEIINIIMHLV